MPKTDRGQIAKEFQVGSRENRLDNVEFFAKFKFVTNSAGFGDQTNLKFKQCCQFNYFFPNWDNCCQFRVSVLPVPDFTCQSIPTASQAGPPSLVQRDLRSCLFSHACLAWLPPALAGHLRLKFALFWQKKVLQTRHRDKPLQEQVDLGVEVGTVSESGHWTKLDRTLEGGGPKGALLTRGLGEMFRAGSDSWGSLECWSKHEMTLFLWPGCVQK